jgi:hypothetical protein
VENISYLEMIWDISGLYQGSVLAVVPDLVPVYRFIGVFSSEAGDCVTVFDANIFVEHSMSSQSAKPSITESGFG